MALVPTGIKFPDNTIQTTSASPANYSQSGYAQANAANDLATSAYNKANTGGVFSGDVTVTGNLIVTGTTTTVNSTYRPHPRVGCKSYAWCRRT